MGDSLVRSESSLLSGRHALDCIRFKTLPCPLSLSALTPGIVGSAPNSCGATAVGQWAIQ